MTSPDPEYEWRKAALKEALKEWLDDKYLKVGMWTVRSFGAAVIGALAWFVIQYHPNMNFGN